MEKKEGPIGIFDSGIGGLTVFKEIERQLPDENLIYFGDTARLPYGSKSQETIIRFSKEILNFLINKDVKLVVVACNTATSLALYELQKISSVSVIGVVEPGVEAALKSTKNKKIGVIGTRSTISSKIYQKKINEKDKDIEVYSKACPLFVPLIEEGWVDDRITDQVIERYLDQFRILNIDTLLLGCTHYPIIKKSIQDFMGDDINVIDSAEVTATETLKLLDTLELKNISNKKTARHFYLSDHSEFFHKLADKFLGKISEPIYYSTENLKG